MRRYTAIKSNVYAPTSTNMIQQNILHTHMTHHYRRMYNAKSKVDSTPPRHFKARNFSPPDRTRKKTVKHPSRSNKSKEANYAEIDLQNQLLINRILYDTKLPPSAYTEECLSQRQSMLGETRRKNSLKADRKKDGKELCPCQNVDDVPSLNIPSNTVRQVTQFRSSLTQTWTKKVVNGSKRHASHVKHLQLSQDALRNNIPRQVGKSRGYHKSQPHRSAFQGCLNAVGNSSGSEGNAGDDEYGVHTSSYDDSNPSDNEKHKLLGREVPILNPKSVLSKAKSKRIVDPCLSIPAIEEVKKSVAPISEVSSRDSAYEGGEGMSSAENPRATPDEVDGNVCRCSGIHYGEAEKQKCMSCPPAREDSQYCSQSELYMKFLQDVTDDVLVQGAFSNEALERVFDEHVSNNFYHLDETHLKSLIEKLAEDLGMSAVHNNDGKLYNAEPVKQRIVCGVQRQTNPDKNWPMATAKFSAKVNDAMEKHVNPTIGMRNEVNGLFAAWDRKQCSLKNPDSSSTVIIDENFALSKSEILECLVDLEFELSMAEEIYETLAGNGIINQDFTLQELQDIMQM